MNNPAHVREVEDAKAYVAAWRRAEWELAAQRVAELRGMSETDSAQCFARLLCPAVPYPLRESSGLVEQQRIFSRLRRHL